MFLEISGDLIKQLEKFTSKLKTRPILQAISIRIDDNQVEFAATDGMKLYVFIREKVETEFLPEQLVIKIPKVKGKYSYFLEKVNDLYLLRNPITEEKVVCEEIKELRYPNYREIIPLEIDKVPYAKTYTAFRSENLAALEFVCPGAVAYRPRTEGPNKPCFWQYERPIGKQIVCLMPYHLAEAEEKL